MSRDGAPSRVTVHRDDDVRTSPLHEGESWFAAAGRTAAGWTGRIEPLDLSGDDVHFAIDPDVVVSVRPMTRGDLPDLLRWRRAEHVRRWFDAEGEPTLEAVTERYGARVDGTSTTRMWVGEVNGRSVGFVQDYRIRDYPGFAVLTPDPDAVGFDYSIGELAWTGRGIGPRMVWAWILTTWHDLDDRPRLFAAPDHRNERSLRMLDKPGFERGTWFDEPNRGGGVDTVVGCTLDVRRVLG
jgi:RimJ/RimL family protein N-acetyltransferase